MGQEEVDRIKDFFSQMQIFPVYLEHEAVITSEDAAKTYVKTFKYILNAQNKITERVKNSFSLL